MFCLLPLANMSASGKPTIEKDNYDDVSTSLHSAQNISHGNDISINSRSKLLLWCSDSLTKMPSNSVFNDTNQSSIHFSFADNCFDTVNVNTSKNLNMKAINKNSSVALSPWSCPLCGKEEDKTYESSSDGIKILTCFHQFCSSCADKIPMSPCTNTHNQAKSLFQLCCPICSQITQVSNRGAKGLMTKGMWKSLCNVMGSGDTVSSNVVNSKPDFNILPLLNNKTADSSSCLLSQNSADILNNIVNVVSAAATVSSSCTLHQAATLSENLTEMEGLVVDKVGEEILEQSVEEVLKNHNNYHQNNPHSSSLSSTTSTFPPPCTKHPAQNLKYICKTCNLFTCPDCFTADHSTLGHEYFSFGNNSLTAACFAEVGSSHNPSTLLLGALNNLYDPKCKTDFVQRTKSFVDAVKIKLVEYELILKSADKIAQKLQTQYLQAKRDVGEATMTFHNAIESRKTEVLKELESSFINKEMKISLISQKLRDFMQKSFQNIQNYEKTFSSSSVALKELPPSGGTASTPADTAPGGGNDNLNKALKQFFDPRLFWLFSISPTTLANHINNYDLEFITYLPAIANVIKSSFGHVKENAFESPMLLKMILDFWREENNGVAPLHQFCSEEQQLKSSLTNVLGSGSTLAKLSNGGDPKGFFCTTLSNNTHHHHHNNQFNSGTGGSYDMSQMMQEILKNWYNYEKWATDLTTQIKQGCSGGHSNAAAASNCLNPIPTSLSEDLKAKLEQAKFENAVSNNFMMSNGGAGGGILNNSANKMIDLLAIMENSAIPMVQLNDVNGMDLFSFPPDIITGHPLFTDGGGGLNNLVTKSTNQIKRRKMIYHCKFGEFGLLEGQFTEPSGVTVNAQGDIIVADTNNHRIQIFDREGRFKFQFGECGKRDGQLLYPNRVAAVRSSGDIVVTERSPTHQIQIFDKFGRFLRKFGADILQHPRGVSVDSEGRIVIVECKVMRVVIFDIQTGEVLHKFGCSKHLEFPNGLAVNDKREIFISDNRAHSVKVFDYQGNYLRQIGGPGITNYPIGVGIEYSTGRLLVADNHNNFNLTIFDQQGNLLDALESKVKHAQCFDVALLDDDSMVLASKDFRIYVYRYNNLTTSSNVLNITVAGEPDESAAAPDHNKQPLQIMAASNSKEINGINTSNGLCLSPGSNNSDNEVSHHLSLVNTNPDTLQGHQPQQGKPIVFNFSSNKPACSYINLPSYTTNTTTKECTTDFLGITGPGQNRNLPLPSGTNANGNNNNNLMVIQAYNAYFNKLFEHPSLNALSQQWQNNWFLIAQQQFHQLGPAQQQLFLQYQQQQQHHLNNATNNALFNGNNGGAGGVKQYHHSVTSGGATTNNTHLIPMSQVGTGGGSVISNNSNSFNSLSFSSTTHEQQQLLEKSCYDRAAKNACSVLSSSSIYNNNNKPNAQQFFNRQQQQQSPPFQIHPHYTQRIKQQPAPGYAHVNKDRSQLSSTSSNLTTGISDMDDPICVPNNVAAAFGANLAMRNTRNGLVPDLANGIEGPLNSFGFYKPQYWSPYDSVMAFVNDSMVPGGDSKPAKK